MDISKLSKAINEEIDKFGSMEDAIGHKANTIIDISSFAAGMGVSHCANRVISDVMANALPPAASIGLKVANKIGTFAISGIVDYAIMNGANEVGKGIKICAVIGKVSSSVIKKMKEDENGQSEAASVEFEVDNAEA